MDPINVETGSYDSHTDGHEGANVEDLSQQSSKLSPLAVPFVPKMPAVSSGGLPESNMSARSSLSVNAPEFVPTSFIPKVKIQYLPPPVDVVAEARNFVWILTRDPENLESLIPSFFSLCADNIQNDLLISRIVDEIFNQAINEANFRYTGARLFTHLSEQVCQLTGFDFQQLLVHRCLQEHGYLQLMRTPDNLPRLIGFTLFLGELLVNMKDLTASSAVMQFPQEIVKLMLLLLSYRTEEAIRCVVQVLKLSGSVLEDGRVALDEVFFEIQSLLADPRLLPGNLHAALTSVVNLRRSSWGRNHAAVSAFSGSEAPLATNAQYCEIKHQSFEEENDLCDDFDRLSGFTSSDSVDTSNGFGGEYWGGDQVMDSDTAAAYEQFLRDMRGTSRSAPACAEPSNGDPTHHFNGGLRVELKVPVELLNIHDLADNGKAAS